MEKSVYLGECQLRHPQFQRDLLAFHQQFPPLFTWAQNRPFRHREGPPRWLQDFFQFRKIPPRSLKVVPKTFHALPYLGGSYIWICADRLGYPQEIRPESGKRYFQILLIKPSTWKHAWAALRSQWPNVYEPFLRYCSMSDLHRLSLLVPGVPFSLDAWLEQVSRAARGAKLMIPIYEDTTLEEVTSLWKRYIQPLNLKRWVYWEPEEASEAGDDEQGPAHQAKRPMRRHRPDQYEIRLQVWDAYERFQSFVDVARWLKQRPTTVKAIYVQASRDIFGTSETPPRTQRQRVLAGFDPATHMQTCETCKKANTDSEFCAQAEAYINQDNRSQRERPYSPEPLDRLGSRSFADE
jgi:hypothetical protein